MSHSKILKFLKIGCMTVALSVIASVYLFFCPSWNVELYNKVIFGNQAQNVDLARGAVISGVSGKNVYFDSDRNKLCGRLYDKKDTDLIFLYSHGKGLNVTWIDKKVSWLLDCGCSVFAYDYRGFGSSEGKTNLVSITRDAQAAYDYVLNNTRFDARNIIIYGESLGTGPSAFLAKNVECSGLILDSPYISIHKIGYDTYPFLRIYPSFCMPKPNLDNEDAIKKIKKPVLILSAKNDKHISVEHSKQLFRVASNPKTLTVLDNSFHGNFEKDLDAYKQSIKGFIKRCRKFNSGDTIRNTCSDTHI